jgi:hypothetical protein
MSICRIFISVILLFSLKHASGQDTTSFYCNSDKHLKGLFDLVDTNVIPFHSEDAANLRLYKFITHGLFCGKYQNKYIYIRFEKQYWRMIKDRARGGFAIKVNKTDAQFDSLPIYDFSGTF